MLRTKHHINRVVCATHMPFIEIEEVITKHFMYNNIRTSLKQTWLAAMQEFVTCTAKAACKRMHTRLQITHTITI